MGVVWDPPQKVPRGSLSLGHADHPLATSDIVHSTRVGILSGRLSTISGYLTVVILSGPAFHHLRIYHIRRLSPDGRGGRFNFPGQTCPDPNELVVGWERSTIQLPRTDMSGSSGNAYLENIRSRRFSFLGQTCPNPLVTLPRIVWLVRYSRFAGSISAHNQKANSNNTDDQVS